MTPVTSKERDFHEFAWMKHVRLARSLPGISYAFGIILISGVLMCCQKTLMLDASFAQEDIEHLPMILPASPDSIYQDLKNRDAVLAFYRLTNQNAVWVGNEQNSAVADSLIEFIRKIRYYGLMLADYHLPELEAESTPAWRRDVLLRRDVILTDAFLSLANDLRYGRVQAVGPRMDSLRVALLVEALREGSLSRSLASQEPAFPQYRNLKKALRIAIDGTDTKSKELLLQGITSDSIPDHHNVRIIEINLERWREEKSDWGPRYIEVNIPSFMIRVVDDYEIVLESRAIVGKPENPTPQFSSVVQCFVTYPYWHVPRKISVDEFLPAIQRDTSFIRRNNFDVLDRKGNVLNPDSIPWSSFHKNNFPVILRQREGTENSLGVIKFVFDNPYAVFVHDTNAPRLFKSKKRAFSHGCIRMEKARALGHYLITGDVTRKSPLLEKYLDQKMRHTIEVVEPIDIHIRYFTASADVDGNVEIYDDVYGKDPDMMQAFYRKAPLLSKLTTP